MIVVSNTSPIINLACIDEAALLQRLFNNILVPSEVTRELRHLLDTRARFQKSALPNFLRETSLANTALLQALQVDLDGGEAAAIALAVEQKANVLLMDEIRGRKIATRFGIPTLGLLGVLKLAKQRGLIPAAKPLVNRLEQDAGFWLGLSLKQRFLADVGEV